MSLNIVIDKAKEFDGIRRDNNLEMHYFDNEKGYWRNNKSGMASILDEDFKKPSTKKCDVETGEDKKGE